MGDAIEDEAAVEVAAVHEAVVDEDEAAVGEAFEPVADNAVPIDSVLIDSVNVPQVPVDTDGAHGAASEPARTSALRGAAVLDSERRQLIDLLIYAWDRARSPGVWERLAAGLADVGVQVLRPDGEPFDPNAHEVGGTEHSDDPAKMDTVAETEVVGFADRGTVIREPIVVVYRRGPAIDPASAG